MTSLGEFLDKISPLKTFENSKQLGLILFQLRPSFTVNDFKNVEVLFFSEVSLMSKIRV